MALQDKIDAALAQIEDIKDTFQSGTSLGEVLTICEKLTATLLTCKEAFDEVKTIIDDHESRISSLENP